MHSRHTYIFVLACSVWACGSSEQGQISQSGGISGTSGSNTAGSVAASGAGSGGAASGAGGTAAAGKAAGGSGESTGGGGNPSTAGSGGSTSQRCLQPQDRSGNWTECSSRTLHRTAPGTCDSNLPRARVIEPLRSVTECKQDSECTEHPYGFCEDTFLPPLDYGNKCNYGCVADSDCKEDEICVCVPFRPYARVAIGGGDEPAGPDRFQAIIGSCQPSLDGCRSDQDCSAGAWCSKLTSNCDGTGVAFACQMPTDECASDFDCPGSGQFCSYENGARVCKDGTCPP